VTGGHCAWIFVPRRLLVAQHKMAIEVVRVVISLVLDLANWALAWQVRVHLEVVKQLFVRKAAETAVRAVVKVLTRFVRGRRE